MISKKRHGLIRVLSPLRYSLKFWLGVSVVVFGFWAFAEYNFSTGHQANADPGIPSIGFVIYKTFQMFILESGAEGFNSWKLELARYATLLLFLTAVTEILIRVFQEPFDAFRLQLMSGHTVVCGLGKVGQQLFDDAIEQVKAGRKWYHFTEWTLPGVVVIEKDGSKNRIRRLRSRGGIVVVGDATNEKLLESVGVLCASRIFVVTGSDEANAEIVFDCINLMRADGGSAKGSKTLDCYVQIADPTVSRLFSQQTSRFTPALPIDLRVFNPAANCARSMIETDALNLRPKTEHEVSLFVIIGFGKVAQAIALQIAELAHFENRKRARLLVIEEDIVAVTAKFTSQFGTFTHSDAVCDSYEAVRFDAAGDSWDSRHHRAQDIEQVPEPGIEYLCNAQFVESPKHFSDRGFIDLIHRVTQEQGVKPVVIVCRDLDRENFDIAGILAEQMEPLRSNPMPIFAWLPEQPALEAILRESGRTEDLRCVVTPIGSCTQAASLDGLIDQEIELLASKLHKNYQETSCSDRIGACADWENLPETFRHSNRSAAIHALVKRVIASAINDSQSQDEFSARTIEILAEVEHNRWVAERLLAGWRYGPVRDSKRKTRPSNCAWNDLPEKEKRKDRANVETALRVLAQSVELKARRAKLLAEAQAIANQGSANVNEKRVVAGILQNDAGDILLTYNEKWDGYAFPMIALADDEPPMGSTAVAGLEKDLGQALPKAKANELGYIGKYGVSERSNEDSFYSYWLFSIDPGEELATSDRAIFVPLDQLASRDDVTWSTKEIAAQLLSNRQVSLAVVSRLGRIETEYLVVWNDGYGGYFLPAMRRKSEVSSEAVAKQILRDDFGYTGDVQAAWLGESQDIHFSDRFSSQTMFTFHFSDVILPGLDIHQPYNELERDLLLRGIRWKWLTADELQSEPDMSPTFEPLRSALHSFVRPERRETPLPVSKAVIALFSRGTNEHPEYLAQWNEHWKCFFLIGGHCLEDVDSRDRAIAKASEELKVLPEQLQVAESLSGHLAYEALSRRTNELTSYDVQVFDAELTGAPLAANPANRWLTQDEIQKGGANDGRPISSTVAALVS